MASEIAEYGNAVETIKAAILRAQYAAAKSTNTQQLQLYYAVGGYLAHLSEQQRWGSGALDAIGERLQRDLPGLRGFSGRNLRYMRTFYSEWCDKLGGLPNLELASAELTTVDADGFWNSRAPESGIFPLDEFLSIGFTHHRWILSLAKTLDERLFYHPQMRRGAPERPLRISPWLFGGLTCRFPRVVLAAKRVSEQCGSGCWQQIEFRSSPGPPTGSETSFGVMISEPECRSALLGTQFCCLNNRITGKCPF